MRRHTLIRKLYPTYLAVVAIGIGLTVLINIGTTRRLLRDETARELLAAARIAALHIPARFSDKERQELDAFCKTVARETGTRLTIILPDGVVIADGEENPAAMDNHADRPEVVEAFRGNPGRYTRYSNTLRREMVYRALPVMEGGKLRAVCRASKAVAQLQAVRRELATKTLAGAGLAVLAGAAFSFFLGRTITRPIADMRDVARRLSDGELGARMRLPDTEELAGLAKTVNRMSDELSERMEAMARQNRETGAVLNSMSEGLVAVDADLQVLKANRAAFDMLNVAAPDIVGHSLPEVVRNPALYELARRTLASADTVEDEALVRVDGRELFLQLRGNRFPASGPDGGFGAVIVLSDVTRMKRLENLRHDFAANVSHELRTPITSIKGFVETLLDGAIGDEENAERFLRIILAHANRLEALISDLLALARIEKQTESGQVALVPDELRPILDAVAETFATRARDAGIRLEVTCPADVRAPVNRGLFEQAVANLVDNAIKHTNPSGSVTVGAAVSEGNVRITVADTGCGIPAEHLDRLFERFYRVDKGRSRDGGGTGLGLAIVKHVAQVHRGHVEVQSTPGVGSTFTLVLPAG